MYKDVNGVCIETGTVVKHGNKQGIVVDDEFEPDGQVYAAVSLVWHCLDVCGDAGKLGLLC